MAENTTDETVNFNSEDNSQGPTNPKDRRTGYSSVGELLKANYMNTLRKGATSLKPVFRAAMAGQLPAQKAEVKQPAPKTSFTMEDVAKGAMPTTAQVSEKQPIPVVKKDAKVTEKPADLGLQKSKSNINTYDNALIAVDNQAKIYANQLSADMPMRDVFITQKREDFLSRFKAGELRLAKDDKGFPVLKNVIDGKIASFLDGFNATINTNKEVEGFDMMDKDEQIAFMKGNKRVQLTTIGEAGKPNKVRYTEMPRDKDLGTIQTERRGFGAETAGMMGGVVPDIGTGIAVSTIPGLGQFLSPAVVGAVQAKRQQFDSKNQAFQKAKQSGLSDDDAYEVANNFWNSKVSLMTGAAEGVVSQYLGSKILKKFSEIKPARELKSFGQATKAFLKDAAANGKELSLSGTLDGAVAYSMEKIRGGSDEAAEEQFKAEFLTQLGFAAVGGAIAVPKYVKSYAYNAISNLDNQTIYNNMVAMEQSGLVPEGTAKKSVEDIDKFREAKGKVMVSNQDAVPTVAGLTIKAEGIQQKIANTPETDLPALAALNAELQDVNGRIARAQVSEDPLFEEVDDKTGLNIKNKQYATQESTDQQQEITPEGNIIQREGIEGQQDQATNEPDNRYRNFGSKTQGQIVVVDAQNADTSTVENPKTFGDRIINYASNVVSALKSINPGVKVVVVPSAQQYGDILIQQEIDNGYSVSKDKEGDYRASNGAFDRVNNTIYLNGEVLGKKNKTSTIFHEGAHPIINMIAQQNSEAVGQMYDQLRNLSESVDGVMDVLAFGDGYAKYGDDTVKSEAIVEFIARVADGQIELPADQPIVMNNILDVIKGFLEIIGFNSDIQSIDDLKAVAAKIKEAFQTGREVVIVSETSGSATEAGLTSNPIKINAGGIQPNGRKVNKEGLNLEIAERNFDEKSLRFITMNDLDGANAFIFAADKAISAIVKSPSGYVHEFNGGVAYSYQDGTGVWAFTTKAAAQKFLNRAKESDGIGLIMSQKEEGITGSYDFYGYMMGEFYNAVDKGVPEKDLVKYLDAKLDTNVSTGVTFRQLLADKGKKTSIESLSDLDGLMPIEGAGKFSYDQRGGFTKKVFSAFTEKNFGIPRLETALEISNEPMLKNADYGDIVAAIQIDKNSPIIDTRTDDRFKNHPSYPFIVTGQPIGIFEDFYDVRKIAPDFVPASKEANQTPLGQRAKPQAAKSAMGAQPIVKLSSSMALQVDNGIKSDRSSGTTQVATTTGSYVKAANIAKSLGAKSILDYGAGLGLGSDAMSDIVPNVESFEPNPERWKGKKQPAFTSSADINKTYDAVVSLNVLNVVPKDIRDAIVKDIYNKLNNGGSAIISSRGWTGDINLAKNAEKGPEPKSAIIKRKEAGGITDVYQKGFDGNELVEYVSDLLGDNATVKKDNSFGKAGVVVTKNEGSLQLEKAEGKTRKSAKQTAKENARTEADAISSFEYNMNATTRAQESVSNTGIINKLKNAYKNIKLLGIENQTSVRKLFTEAGATGALADAMLTTSRGFGAQAALATEDVIDAVYKGLSDKKDLSFGEGKIKFSEVDLLNQIMNMRRVVAVQNMVQDKFNELQAMRAQMKKLRSKAKKEALQVKIDAAVEYLEDRKVLGKKYNPQKKETTEYLQNYQVGSTIDANGNKVPYNAGMASKQLETIESAYPEFEKLNERADKMFDTYRNIMKEKLDNGLVSKETYDMYIKYDYVPISYIDKILKEQDPDYARVMSKNPNQLRKSVLSGGADGDILTDYEAIFQVFATGHYKNVSNNRAATQLANFAEQNPNNGLVEIARPVVDEDGDVVLDKDGNPVYKTAPEGMSYVFFYQNGQRNAILVTDEIADQWNARYSQSDEINILANITFASLTQKLLTGKNPGFGIFQMIALDPLTAAVATDVFSPSVPVAYAQIALGGVDTVGWKGSIKQVIGRGDKYRLAAKWGAFTEMNAGRELETSLLSKDIVDGTGYEKLINTASQYSSKPIEFIDKLIDKTGLGKVSDVTEKATRLIIFDRARKVFEERFEKENKRKPSKAELDEIYAMAAHEARRSSDFARGGSLVKPASRLIIYLNSTVQTGVSVINQIKKNPARAMYQMGEMLAIGGLLTAYSAGVMDMPWEDDEEKKKKKAAWDSLSEYQKLNYLNIYVGGDAPERQFIKVPMPPVFKNFWVAAMMGFESKRSKNIYTIADYLAAISNANPFGDITEIPAKLPPGAAALLAYNNLDIFTKKQIVTDEAGIPDDYEGAMDEAVGGVYKKIGSLTGTSPARLQAAGQKIYGQPERNPLIYIPKIAFETAVELATGAPITLKEGLEKDWKGAILNGLSLQKRLFAGTPNYYQTRIMMDYEEIDFLKSKAHAALMNKDTKMYDKYNADIASKNKEIQGTLNVVNKNYPSLYERLVKESANKAGGLKYDLSPNVAKATTDKYIKQNYDQQVYEAYRINDPKTRAKYIYDKAKEMDKKESQEYFDILYKLRIMNADNPTGIQYMKILKTENK
jgi:hypothetical protein